jgi:hypothetical protein
MQPTKHEPNGFSNSHPSITAVERSMSGRPLTYFLGIPGLVLVFLAFAPRLASPHLFQIFILLGDRCELTRLTIRLSRECCKHTGVFPLIFSVTPGFAEGWGFDRSHAGSDGSKAPLKSRAEGCIWSMP